MRWDCVDSLYFQLTFALKESKRKKAVSEDEDSKPRYTLFELEEVLNEKNKYKG